MTELQRIAVACDPTREPRLDDDAAAQRALLIAEHTGAEVVLFVCGYDQALSGDRFFDSKGLQKSRDSYVNNLRLATEKLAESMRRSGVKVGVEASWDYPIHEGIVRAAMRCKADLLIKETHHHGPVDRFLFTNTDWHLIRDCPMPLLLCKQQPRRADQPILAAVDPMHENDKDASLDRKILNLGGKLSASMGSELHAVHAVNAAGIGPAMSPGVAMAVYLPADTTIESIVEAHKTAFEELASKHGIPAERAHLRQGTTGEVLNTLIAETGAGTVIMGAVARGRLERVLVGSTAERVLNDLNCDVLVVKPDGFTTTVKPGNGS